MQSNSIADSVITELYDLFRQRCAEVHRYIEITSAMSDHRNTKLVFTDSTENTSEYEISRELKKTLKANTYLLLYNLVEATMTNAVDAIHKAIYEEKLNFNDLSDELKFIVLRYFNKATKDFGSNGGDLIGTEAHPIEHAILKFGYNREKIFSGNVDCTEIRETAKKYGFKSPDPNKNGREIARKLKEIKNRRNALAHGRQSFEDCGQYIASDSLEQSAHEIIVYLRLVIWSVSKYIRQEMYKIKSLN
ncbi:hypothetical protein LX59_03031 [Azomonas agilis]|uniref:MAE-28990/MAE-18760-like HEPN domain-containing protein n=1 Tax=Azomonas agilis TaxID=116849 RepID=A0A562HYK2_9GAMM|nr:MAE_28990/MAE_18760 family HEPN-like nuclease [Azomonas agilis]TWH63867.1 hypothetical protein LX59_03031 [Azomonas agilis]